jgi:hypothetical protein
VCMRRVFLPGLETIEAGEQRPAPRDVRLRHFLRSEFSEPGQVLDDH